ncbi:hypothetical protein CMEL01_14812 [Colletotrichum melonis]|uniref:Uncharacterized protein n=2 Tax=Colletotrichum acutatum species complex TaxID=2707335 RepID=A0AAI9XS99_9PEZI|nr:hypothetical protein CMEL01_14812 [Colletotrichum melonis]
MQICTYAFFDQYLWSIQAFHRDQAASTYSNTPEIIFEFLAQIPDMMESSRQYMAMYRNMGGHRLDKRSFELFQAVLEALIHVMQFFLNSRLSRLPSDFQILINNDLSQAGYDLLTN